MLVRRRWLFFLLAWTLLPVSAMAQEIQFDYPTYGLERDSLNVIQNAAHLDSFFQKLFALKNGEGKKVSIMHIGDSHIQGDYLTQPVRKNFQQRFGNAGRGLVVPGRVAGTNESYNIVSSATGKWNARRCVQAGPLPIGIGGITVSSDSVGAGFSIAMNDLWLDYRFNSIELFCLATDSYDFMVTDSAQNIVGAISPGGNDNHFRLSLPKPFGAVSITSKKSFPWQNHATVFGISLENGARGVLYHAIGVNGAKYKHYLAATDFAAQTKVLNPDLIILSLGTNEALEFPGIDPNFPASVEGLIAALLRANPQTAILVTTPPPAFRNGDRANPGIENIRGQLIGYAVENGFAFWDMYLVMGGAIGATQWRNAVLLRPDGIHFTKDGYAYQGDIFFHAIMKAYNQYVLRHRP